MQQYQKNYDDAVAEYLDEARYQGIPLPGNVSELHADIVLYILHGHMNSRPGSVSGLKVARAMVRHQPTIVEALAAL